MKDKSFNPEVLSFACEFARKITAQIGFADRTKYSRSTKGMVIKMDIKAGDTLEMKKEHPCGSKTWKVLRVGMDFRLKCTRCGREVMLARRDAEKNIKKVFSSDNFTNS